MTDPVHDIARAVVDATRYMVLGTADAAGVPWTSPVWFAPAGYREFLWVSNPQARHSRNIAGRPEVSIVLYDSHVRPGDAQAVYAAAVAEQVDGADVERGIDTFSAHSVRQGLPVWTAADVTAPARHRLYRATVRECFVLGARDERVPVPLDAL